MKTKTLMAAAAMALLVALPARATEPPTVVSANTVGYSKLTLKAGEYTLIANPFVEVGTGDNIAINDMFTEDTTDANAGSSFTAADTLEVWNGTGYTTYYFRSATPSPYWMKLGDRKATTDEIPLGQAAFYHNYSPDEDVTLTISGEVKTNAETLAIAPGYNLLKNPFPVPMSFTNFAVSGATAGSSFTQADTIEVWNGSGYTTYYYRSASPSPYWMKLGDRKATTDTLAPYAGFFYHAIGSNPIDVTIQSPIAEP